MIQTPRSNTSHSRRQVVLVLMALTMLGMVTRAIYLQILNRPFLQQQANIRHIRERKIPAHRGMIVDRHGEPLAASSPVDSVWANPQALHSNVPELSQLAELLELSLPSLQRKLNKKRRQGKKFFYLKRRINPARAQQVMALKVSGIHLERSYRRFYPSGEILGQVIGFTNIDDQGQEGLERVYNNHLRGIVGLKKVVLDGHQQVVADIAYIRDPQPGQDLILSIDRRLQYLAYRELKAAALQHQAKGASLVLLHALSGEILAMVNQPSFNPNRLANSPAKQRRNRAVTDVFEPGSTIKPFTIASALAQGIYQPDSLINTHPGYLRVGRKTIRDHHNLGLIDVTTIIQKSSNVGATKIALKVPIEQTWSFLSAMGFGHVTGSGFPGEAAGHLSHFKRWYPIDRATLAYGYGLSVTALQLARAYAILAADGVAHPISFLRKEAPSSGPQVMPARTARQVRAMMETVIRPGGTATKAQIPGYRVAGKTGTVKKAKPGGYYAKRYRAVFAGIAPASHPKLVMAVMIDDPSANKYYGGVVAAPVFQRVMREALRLLDIPPDDPASLTTQTASVMEHVRSTGQGR